MTVYKPEQKINELMDDFLLFFLLSLGVQRAIKSFSCWRFADLRDYSYTLPTFAFAHSKDCSENYRITQGLCNLLYSFLQVSTPVICNLLVLQSNYFLSSILFFMLKQGITPCDAASTFTYLLF